MKNVSFKVIYDDGSIYEPDDASYIDDIHYSFDASMVDNGILVRRNDDWVLTSWPSRPVVHPSGDNEGELFTWESILKGPLAERKLIWTKDKNRIECIIVDEDKKRIHEKADLLLHLPNRLLELPYIKDDLLAKLALWNGCCNEDTCCAIHDWVLLENSIHE